MTQLLTGRSLVAGLMAGAAVCALTTPGLAQDEISLDPVIVQAYDDWAGAADRATTQYVSQAELERARTGDLKDLFAGIASVAVGGAVPVAQKIFVNGVDMLNLSVTVDDVAQNNRAFHHVSANAIDPGLLKAVRADAGAAPADAGPHAMAGSVVFETVDAADILEDGRNFGGNTTLSFGDNGRTGTAALTLAGRQGGFEWLGYLKTAKGKDYRTGAGNTLRGTAADMQSALLKVAYEGAEGHRFELSAMELRDDALRRYRANIGAVIGGRPVPELRRYDTARRNLSLTYHNTQGGGMWDPKVVLGFSESMVNIPDPEMSEGTSNTTSAKVQNTFHLSDGNTIVAGLDVYRRTSTYEDTDEYYRETARNIGLFAQARLQPTEPLKISFGLRADWQTFNGEGGFKGSYSGLSGNASVSYAVTQALTLRAGVSSVFGGLSLEDNYEFWRSPTWNYGSLKSARSQNYTLGADYVAGNLRLGGELFLTRMSNARAWGGNIDFESRGFNLGATYGWDDGFARLTYSSSKVKVNGALSGSYEAVDFGAPLGQILAFEVQQQVGQNWTLGGSLDMALDYTHVAAGSDITLKGYEVVNVFAEYVPPSLPNLRLRAEVANLFDRDYADRATYGADYTSISAMREPGRTFKVSLVTRF